MKKAILLLLAVVALSGCTTYKFQKGLRPYDKGYVVSRRGFVIPEYTIGENSTVPADLELAQERFSRRKKSVEYYYEKLGDIDSNFKSYFLKPLSTAGGMVASPVRLPLVAYQDYKYQHNPDYKEKMDKLDDQADQKQRNRVKIVRDYLSKYIQDDLAFERELMAAKGKTEARELAQKPSKQEEKSVEVATEAKPEEVAIKEKSAETAVEEKPTAVVMEEKPAEVATETKPAEVATETKPAEVATETKPAEVATETKPAEVATETKPVEVATETKSAEAVVEDKPVEAVVETGPAEVASKEKSVEIVQPAEVTPPVEAIQAKEVPVVEAPVKEEKMDEELVKQEVKPKKAGLWQKTKNFFKGKPKQPKPQEEMQEAPAKAEKPPKESLWSKMFKPKEKTVKLAKSAERIPGEPPVAIIMAKPIKGFSPLKVHFSAGKSHAIKGKIVSYEWDFSDGDKAKKPDPINTFYSGSFEPKQFIVTLTVQDDKGNIGTATQTIEVLNK